MDAIDTDGMQSYIVIAEDDCHKFYAESIIAFTFKVYMLIEPIREENSVKIYRTIQEHFKVARTTMWK